MQKLPLTVIAILFGIITPNALADIMDFLTEDIPVAITPTRLKQPLSDIPANVTILPGARLRKLGITNIPDALRLVPGMAVAQTYGNEFQISYHGTSALHARRMQVLIDGMSAYRPGIARVDWLQLPVNMSEISRIEITRSPDSATYGSNAFFAVINIITQTVEDSLGTKVTQTSDNTGNSHSHFQYSDLLTNDSSYQINLSIQEQGGFDNYMNDNHDQSLAKLRYKRDFGHYSWNIQASTAWGTTSDSLGNNKSPEPSDIDFKDTYIVSSWDRPLNDNHQLQIKAYGTQARREQLWPQCAPTIIFTNEAIQLSKNAPELINQLYMDNPKNLEELTEAVRQFENIDLQTGLVLLNALLRFNSLGADALTPICGDADITTEESRFEIEVQDTMVLSENLRVVSGLGFGKNMASSITYLGGTVHNNYHYLLSNMEYRASSKLIINTGGILEKEDFTNLSFSPRFAANYHLTDHLTLRSSISKATRSPDIIEQAQNVQIYATNLSDNVLNLTEGFAAFHIQSPGNLKTEKITATEIGIYAHYPQHGLNFNAKFYREKLKDLISQSVSVFETQFDNDNMANIKGGELEINYQISSQFKVLLNYAYTDLEASNPLEKSLNSRHSGSAALFFPLINNWHSNLAYYGSDSVLGSHYDRVDFNMGRYFNISQHTDGNITFSIKHRLNEDFNINVSPQATRLNAELSRATQATASFGLEF